MLYRRSRTEFIGDVVEEENDGLRVPSCRLVVPSCRLGDITALRRWYDRLHRILTGRVVATSRRLGIARRRCSCSGFSPGW